MNTVHFETTLCNFLDRYLVDRDCIDMHKPECPDAMDDYIIDEVLCLKGEDKIKLQNLVMNCASGANDMLIHSGVESGTREAFELFVSCLRQMYMYGMYIELKSLGYHMTAIN